MDITSSTLTQDCGYKDNLRVRFLFPKVSFLGKFVAVGPRTIGPIPTIILNHIAISMRSISTRQNRFIGFTEPLLLSVQINNPPLGRLLH